MRNHPLHQTRRHTAKYSFEREIAYSGRNGRVECRSGQRSTAGGEEVLQALRSVAKTQTADEEALLRCQ